MKEERRKNLKLFFGMLMRFRIQHFGGMILSLINSALLLLQPIVLMKIIDEGIIASNIAVLVRYISFFGGLVVLQNISEYIKTYIYSFIGKKFIYELRIKVLKHIEKMSGQFLVNTNAGELFTIFDDDIDNIEQLASNMISTFISGLMVSVAVCIYLCRLQPELFLIILISQPIMFYIQKRINKKTNLLSFVLRDILGQIVKEVQEYLGSVMQFIKMNAKQVFWSNYNKSGSEYTQKSLQLDMSYGKSVALGSVISGIVVCIIFGYGGYKVVAGELTIGGLITFNQYSQKLFQPIISIARNSTYLKRILVSLDKVFNLLRIDSGLIEERPIYNNHIVNGDIRFCNVKFGYDVNRLVYDKLNIHFANNMFTGIVGRSGEGKTTIINLLLRLWDVIEGCIEIDGVNLKNYNIEKLRDSISVVTQDVFLLNDTIKNNLTLLDKNISMREIEEITKKLGLYDFIQNSPEGFETIVGDNGIKLSGGQKQRISIARVLLKNNPVIIFDEATASLDNNAQEEIIKLIFEYLKNKTVIIIAHRLKVVRECDNIIVIDNGRMIESGTHDLLMKKEGLYYNLYKNEK